MAAPLVASLVLNLKDNLSEGLNKLKDQLEKLGSLGKKLGLGKLETGAGALERTSSAAQGLTGHLRGVAGMADRAYASLKRMAAVPFKRISAAVGEQSRIGAFGAAAEGISVAAPILKYASFEDSLRHIAITKGLSGAAADAEIKRLNRLISHEALSGSQSSESVAGAYYGLQTGGAGTASQIEEALAAHTRAATAYKVDPEAFTPVTLALMKNFKIFGDDLGRSLAAVGQASKEGQLKVTDYAGVLPQVAGPMNTAKLTGFNNANLAIAALQSIRTDVGEAGQAGTDFAEMLRSMYSTQGQKGFALEGKGTTGAGPGSFIGERARALMRKALGSDGIDVHTLIENAAKQGIGPIDAVLNKLMLIKSKLSAHDFSDLLNQMFTNGEALKGWQALLNHAEQFKALRAELDGINAAKVATDNATASAGPEAAVRRAEEGASQGVRRIGEGFAPLLTPVNAALQGILAVTEKLDDALPGLGNGILIVTGAFLAFGAAVAAIGFAWPTLSTGFALFGSVLSGVWTVLTFIVGAIEGIVPAIAAVAGVSAGVVAGILVAVAALVAAAYDIYAGWATFKGFFLELWQGVVDVFEYATLFIIGVFLGRMDLASAGLRMIWHGIEEFFGGLWNAVMQLFVDFGTEVDKWTGGAMTKAVDGIKSAWGVLKQWFADLWADIRKPFDNFVNTIVTSPIGKLMGLSGAAQLQPPGSGKEDGKAGTGAGMDAAGGSLLMPPFSGQVTVGVDPNNGQIRIVRTETSSPGFSILNTPLDPGLALAVP